MENIFTNYALLAWLCLKAANIHTYIFRCHRAGVYGTLMCHKLYMTVGKKLYDCFICGHMAHCKDT